MLLYLPLAHNFGRLMHLAGPYVGFTIAFLPDPLQGREALQAVRPTVFPSVPRVYEKIHTAIVAGARRRDRREEPTRRLVVRGRPRSVSESEAAGQAAAALSARAARDRRPARLLEDSRAARRHGSAPRSRWSAAREGDRRVLRRVRRSGSSRATASPSARRLRRRTRPSAGVSARSARRSPASSCSSPTTASS